MAARYITPTNAASLADEIEEKVRRLIPFLSKHEFNSFAHQPGDLSPGYNTAPRKGALSRLQPAS